MVRVFLVCLGVLIAAPAFPADRVVPTDRVVTGVTLRAGPSTETEALGLLRPGESLDYEGSVPRWHRVRTADGELAYVSAGWSEIVADPDAALYRFHVVDVGTGLALILEGEDVLLVYDGGSNDDRRTGPNNRLSAYFAARLPGRTVIDHVILSHPHRDHVELLPDLFASHDVRHVWDSGRINCTSGYEAFLAAIAAEPGVSYHTPLQNFGTHEAVFDDSVCASPDTPPVSFSIPASSRIDDAPIALGPGASLVFLHADGAPHPSPNENSLVVRLDLNGTRILLMGDAEAGGRRLPGEAPDPHSIEGLLLECCLASLDADILVAGHHGSLTSSRDAFLDAVSAEHFVISSGPTRYGSVVLPDAEIVASMEGRGSLWRTDLDDAACAAHPDKIGSDADGRAGGCDHIVFEIAPDGSVTAGYAPSGD